MDVSSVKLPFESDSGSSAKLPNAPASEALSGRARFGGCTRRSLPSAAAMTGSKPKSAAALRVTLASIDPPERRTDGLRCEFENDDELVRVGETRVRPAVLKIDVHGTERR